MSVSRGRVELSAALSDNVRTWPLLNGVVEVEGAQLVATTIHPSEMFWRQLHFAEFDVCEMSLASLMIAISRGDARFWALPIYTTRRFFHTGILVRRAAGIASPGDLAGKRVGVPEYQQTSAVWSRGILSDQFGVAPTSIQWFMERGNERSHGAATGFRPPPGVSVSPIAPQSDIGQMLLAGELDATLLYLPHANLVDRAVANLDDSDLITTLFPDPEAEGRRYYAATGLFPINHAVIVKRDTLERHPWVALNLYSSFIAARDWALHNTESVLAPYVAAGRLTPPPRLRVEDCMPYGLAAANAELQTVARYLQEQGLTDRLVGLEEVFAPCTLGL